MESNLETRIEREQHLEELVKQKPTAVFSYAVGYDLSQDSFKKGQYVQEMIALVRRKGTTVAYLQGCFVLQKQKKHYLLNQLKQELADKHPVIGRIGLLAYNFGSFFVF